ncbi:SDR family oxidoreductase [Conexibacter sp. SYSU D00693]|uniref:SDR family oxidoreductase n=1 Tax=Conexibacter sp. SYSU D00693 TaxID=2812560 RepID=UPI00196B4CCE|nr:SDR family oxidoreductase [Conexibacter sp. SYSU D00693]
MSQGQIIAVTGATGAVGGRVAKLLADAHAPLRMVVRDASRAPDLAKADVRVAAGYHAHDELVDAFAGAGTVFLIPAAEARDRVEQHKTAVDAAVQAGVEHLVYLSFVDARPDTTFTLGRDHWATEEHIRQTGAPHTFVRMNLYMDFIPSMAGEDGVIRGPAGDGKLAAVLRDDVAAAAAAVLTSTGHDGKAYDLTGPSAFSLGEAAELMTALTGKAVRFHDETDEEAFASRASYGAPDWEVAGWVSSYQAIRDGSLAAVSPDVEQLTGRPPTSLADWLGAHPEALAHLPGA